LAGHVKAVEVTEGKIEHGSEKLYGTTSVKSRTEWSEDGHTIKTVTYDVDTGFQAWLRMYPTTIWQYDASGRLTRETLRLNGYTAFTTTECAYDQQGRVSKLTMRSKNPEFNRTLTYDYGHGWRSERFRSSVASILTTSTLDSSGRVVREVERDELEGYVRSVREYRYGPQLKEACWEENDKRGCTTYKYDGRGNEVEAFSVDGGRSETTYEYDATGNWTRRVTSVTDRSGTPRRIDAVVWRRITYW
jgi:YD repeat-containing protein